MLSATIRIFTMENYLLTTLVLITVLNTVSCMYENNLQSQNHQQYVSTPTGSQSYGAPPTGYSPPLAGPNSYPPPVSYQTSQVYAQNTLVSHVPTNNMGYQSSVPDNRQNYSQGIQQPFQQSSQQMMTNGSNMAGAQFQQPQQHMMNGSNTPGVPPFQQPQQNMMNGSNTPGVPPFQQPQQNMMNGSYAAVAPQFQQPQKYMNNNHMAGVPPFQQLPQHMLNGSHMAGAPPFPQPQQNMMQHGTHTAGVLPFQNPPQQMLNNSFAAGANFQQQQPYINNHYAFNAIPQQAPGMVPMHQNNPANSNMGLQFNPNYTYSSFSSNMGMQQYDTDNVVRRCPKISELVQKRNKHLEISIFSQFGNEEDPAAIKTAARRKPLKAPEQSKVQLSFEVSNLRQRDLFTRSDPYINTYLTESDTPKRLIAKTETVKNKQTTMFRGMPIIDYHMGHTQALQFDVWDYDSKGADQFLGSASTTVADILRQSPVSFDLANASDTKHYIQKGKITVTGEELHRDWTLITIDIRGIELLPKDVNGLSDPFIKIIRDNKEVYRSSIRYGTLNPVWDDIQIPLNLLCGKNGNDQLTFICADYDKSGIFKTKDDPIGTLTTTLTQLVTNGEHYEYPLTPSSSRRKNALKFYVHPVQKIYSFVDYITSGLSIQCAVGIDFSARNIVRTKNLHAITSGSLNSYETAIRSVMSILEIYDKDDQFPTYGYEAYIANQLTPVASPLFHINNQDEPHCFKTEGILYYYRDFVTYRYQKGGEIPNIIPLIEKTVATAKEHFDGYSYYVLIIFTAGVVHDLEMTKKAIVEAAQYPISIIIIDLGGTNKVQMQQLDSDDTLLQAGMISAVRDIVQVVDYSTAQFGMDLAAKVLEELPSQVVEFMTMCDTKPTKFFNDEQSVTNNAYNLCQAAINNHTILM